MNATVYTWWQQHSTISITVSHLSFREWTSFEKRNNLDKFITFRPRLKKDLWFKFRLGPKIQTYKTSTIRNPHQKLQLIHAPLCFQNPPICSIYLKNPQSVRFLRLNPSIRKPIHPPPIHLEMARKVTVSKFNEDEVFWTCESLFGCL